MQHTTTGEFEVTLTPQPDAAGVGDALIGRMAIDKTYRGDLSGSGKGQMLGVRTATKGSAGYVAMEKVTGSLQGRAGSFVLQHSSTMRRGEPHQSITVVPDSGTDELAGLSGDMTIDIRDGKHYYRLEYAMNGSAG